MQTACAKVPASLKPSPLQELARWLGHAGGQLYYCPSYPSGDNSPGARWLGVGLADHEELYDEARAERLREMLRALAGMIRDLDRAGTLLASSAELQRLLGDARIELFHYEVRSTYDTPEQAERRRLVDEARAQDFTIDDPEDDEPWRARPRD